MTITDLGDGYSLQSGKTLSLMNCSNNSALYEPRRISYVQSGTKQPGQIRVWYAQCPCTLIIRTRFCCHNMSDNIPPSSYKHLTDVQVMQCLTLSKCGKPVCVIADEVGCSKSMVDRILKEHDYETFITRPKSAGCPRKTMESDDRLLI